MDLWSVIWYICIFKILKISTDCEQLMYLHISETVGDIAKRTIAMNSWSIV